VGQEAAREPVDLEFRRDLIEAQKRRRERTLRLAHALGIREEDVPAFEHGYHTGWADGYHAAEAQLGGGKYGVDDNPDDDEDNG
jgi:hypothetical protein